MASTEAVTLVLALAVKVAIWVTFLFFVGYWLAKPSEKGTKLDENLMNDVMTPTFGMGASWQLVFMAPFVVVAMLAAVYLQLIKFKQPTKQPTWHLILRDSRALGSLFRWWDTSMSPKGGRPRVSLWTYPVLTKGFLGIVTAADLIILLLFLFLNVWVIVWFETVGISNIDYDKWKAFGLERGIVYTSHDIRVDYTGYYFGVLCFVAMAFLLFPVSRGSTLLRLINIPFEHAVRYHIWVGYTSIFIALVHGVIYYSYWYKIGLLADKWKEWPPHHENNLAGLFAIVIGLIIAGTSIHQVRSRFFNFFFGTHQLYILFLVFTMLHIGPNFFYMIMAGVFLFTIDRFLRFIQSRKSAGLLSVRALPGNTTQLKFAKHPGLKYSATSFIFINIPALSRWQWHPFTVVSSSLAEPDHITVLVKNNGAWTKNLGQVVSEVVNRKSCPFSFSLSASVEGPYGPESLDFLRYDSLILLAGGSGLAPFIAILKDLAYRHETQSPDNLPSAVTLIWAVREADELQILNSLTHDSYFPKRCPSLQLDIQTYVTRQSSADSEAQGASGKDGRESLYNFGAILEPVCPEVGKDSNWGHLAVVLASSLGFLLIWGLFGRYWIHLDVRHGFNFSSAGLLNLLAMVLGVVVFGGATVFVWAALFDKAYSPQPLVRTLIQGMKTEDGNGNYVFPQAGVETDRLQDAEDASQAAPADEHSTQLVRLAENVHFGRRPNLEGILDKAAKRLAGTDVGVMVCGPPSMQQSVAAACQKHSSVLPGRANVALHYHSVSFEF